MKTKIAMLVGILFGILLGSGWTRGDTLKGDWLDLPQMFRTGYVSGYIQAMTYVNDTQRQDCMRDLLKERKDSGDPLLSYPGDKAIDEV